MKKRIYALFLFSLLFLMLPIAVTAGTSGPQCLLPRGEFRWTRARNYQIGDVLVYNNRLYKVVNRPGGTSPGGPGTNPQNWLFLETAPSPVQWRAWDSATRYLYGDFVEFRGGIYTALRDNSNSPPEQRIGPSQRWRRVGDAPERAASAYLSSTPLQDFTIVQGNIFGFEFIDAILQTHRVTDFPVDGETITPYNMLGYFETVQRVINRTLVEQVVMRNGEITIRLNGQYSQIVGTLAVIDTEYRTGYQNRGDIPWVRVRLLSATPINPQGTLLYEFETTLGYPLEINADIAGVNYLRIVVQPSNRIIRQGSGFTAGSSGNNTGSFLQNNWGVSPGSPLGVGNIFSAIPGVFYNVSLLK